MRKPAALFLLVLPLLAVSVQAQNPQTAPLQGRTHNNLAFRREPATPTPAPPMQEGRTAPVADCLTFSPTLDDALAQHLRVYSSLAVAPLEPVLQFPGAKEDAAPDAASCNAKQLTR